MIVSINNFYTSQRSLMTLNQGRQAASSHQSRVSSSNSSHESQSYELMPRDEPFNAPKRDQPTPRVSFPFKRVQPGVESSQNNRSHNESRSSLNTEVRQQRQSNELIEAIGSLNNSNNIPRQLELPQPHQTHQIHQTYQSSHVSHQQCDAKIEELQGRIGQLQAKISEEHEDFELERKANEVYMDSFTKLREIINNSEHKLQGQGVEELIDKIQQIVNRVDPEGNNHGHLYDLLQQKDKKISELRLELLKSSQNNINAIFNTEITQAHCLHLQIKKMNGQIVTLKDNLIKVNSQNSYNVHQLQQKDKIVKIYHHNHSSISSSDEQDIHTELKLTRRRHSKRQHRRDSSSSEKYNKSKMLSNTESKVGELVEGYKVLRDEYKRLENTLGQMYENHADYRLLFNSLRTQISSTLQHQLSEVKRTIRRPGSSHSELRVARDVESKLNHLVNTLNAPQRVNIEENMGDDEASDWKNVEVHRKIIDLESHSSHLEHEINYMETENEELKRRIWLSQHTAHRSIQNHNNNNLNSLETEVQHLHLQSLE